MTDNTESAQLISKEVPKIPVLAATGTSQYNFN